MFGNNSPQVARSGRSFFSTLVLGGSLVVVTLIGSATVLAVYALNIVDRKTGNVFEFAEVAVQSVPDLIESLPPVLADLIDDERRPEYAEQLDVSVKLADAGGYKGVRPVVLVHNRGDEVVSLMSMRIVILNDQGDPVSEFNEWGATPIAADRDWRGPLLPGATRRFTAGWRSYRDKLQRDSLRVEYEITDVRIWNRDNAGAVSLTSAVR